MNARDLWRDFYRAWRVGTQAALSGHSDRDNRSVLISALPARKRLRTRLPEAARVAWGSTHPLAVLPTVPEAWRQERMYLDTHPALGGRSVIHCARAKYGRYRIERNGCMETLLHVLPLPEATK